MTEISSYSTVRTTEVVFNLELTYLDAFTWMLKAPDLQFLLTDTPDDVAHIQIRDTNYNPITSLTPGSRINYGELFELPVKRAITLHHEEGSKLREQLVGLDIVEYEKMYVKPLCSVVKLRVTGTLDIWWDSVHMMRLFKDSQQLMNTAEEIASHLQDLEEEIATLEAT